MRKVFLLIALVAIVFASNACGKKDDSKPQEQPKNSLEQKLIGKWKIIEIGLDTEEKEVERIDDCTFWSFFSKEEGTELDYKLENNECVPNEQNKIEENSFVWKVEKKSVFLGIKQIRKIKFI
ncbi:LptM family lipoprotein [Capnocytophaga sputigena]